MATSRDIKQVAGNPVDTGIGPAGQGTQRVAIANNQTIVVSGTVTLSNSTIEIGKVLADQGERGSEPWAISGTVVVSNTVTTNSTILNNPIVIQGNSTGAPWIVSGITLLVDTFTSLVSGISSVQGLDAASNRRLLGFSITETASTPATAQVILHHGTSNAGSIISWVKLSANESTRDWYGDAGIGVANGLYVNRISGTTQVTLFHRTEV